MNTYHLALWTCGQRYKEMLGGYEVRQSQRTQASHELLEFIMLFMDECIADKPVPKLCRWLGYIQGVLIERGITTVQEERDWTRPLFRPLDFPDGEAAHIYAPHGNEYDQVAGASIIEDWDQK